MSTRDSPNLVYDIRNLLIGAAESCNVKKTKTKQRDSSEPWFDDECKALKKKIQEQGKALRRQPNDKM